MKRPVLISNRLLQSVLGGLGVLLLIGVALKFPALMRMSAVAHTDNPWRTVKRHPEEAGRLSLWIETPWVSPGDELAGTVIVSGGYEAAIDSLHVEFGPQQVAIEGQGPTWKESVTRTRWFLLGESEGQDSRSFTVKVPADAEPGVAIPLRCRVRQTLAVPGGVLGFQNSTGTAVVESQVTILSLAQSWRRRALAVVQAMFVFAMPVFALVWCIRRLSGETDSFSPASGSDDDMLAYCWMGPVVGVALIAYSLVGYHFFIRPLAEAARATGAWLRVLLMLIWFVGPLFVSAWLVGRAERRRGRNPLSIA